MISTNNNIWPKHITVDKRIVKILSGSTYTNFPSAIKELIVNSYDADAENVFIDIDLQKEIITIRDDGLGMSEKDFSFYLRIAGKTRKKNEKFTKGKRPIVGQFGVGFLSILPFCEKYIIETKRKETDEIVFATITSSEYFNNDFSAIDVEEIPIHGGLRFDKNLYYDQFTRIRLVGFTKLTYSFFNKEYAIKGRRGTINNYDPIPLLEWNLCEYLPIKYDDSIRLGEHLNKIFFSNNFLDFNVIFNKKKLYRNIHANNILEFSESNEKIGDIVFRYIFLTDYRTIDPNEARFLMQRNLNVGVGSRTAFDLSLDGKVYGKLAHITGEVNIISGLNESISVSRDKFNFNSDYEKLKEFLREKLKKWANYLDNLQTINKSVQEFNDLSKVTDIKLLKSGQINHDIKHLRDKGFTVRSSKSGTFSKLDKAKKEIIIPENIINYTRTFALLGQQYKLILDKWRYTEVDFPAVRISNDIIYVNEDYPLFSDKKNFDTFLKLHIILYTHFEKMKMNKMLYKNILDDILKTFNK